MGMQVYAGGAWRNISDLRVYANKAWRRITNVKVYVSGAWRDVARFVDALSLSTPPNFAVSNNNSTIFGFAGVTPSGGLAPFAYAWTVTASSGGTVTVSAGTTTASATFRATGVALNHTATATFKCVVTDSLGQTAQSTVTGTFQHIEVEDSGTR